MGAARVECPNGLARPEGIQANARTKKYEYNVGSGGPYSNDWVEG